MEIVRFTDIPGIKVGHEQDFEGLTGCTVVICEEGASAGVDVRGGAPGTRETDLLNPVNLVDKMHGVLLAGGSAFGLDAAAGVMQYLEERGIGLDVGVTRVPIVGGTVLFDLAAGSCKARPDKEMGYRACLNAESGECPQGNVGAGTGATVGKYMGMASAMKGGLGTFCIKAGELMVGAVVAVNCLGDVINPENGEILAGALSEDLSFLNTEEAMLANYGGSRNILGGNTTIGVIATNAVLSKTQANKVASMAHNGYGRVIRPAHTMYDGDTIFALATCKIEADVNVIGMLAARVMEQAIVNAVTEAASIAGFRAWRDIGKQGC